MKNSREGFVECVIAIGPALPVVRLGPNEHFAVEFKSLAV